MTLTKSFAALMVAVSIEVIATTLLSLSNSFQRPVVGLSAIISYGISYYFLSIALRRIHLGVAYAIWSAVGLFSITVIQSRFLTILYRRGHGWVWGWLSLEQSHSTWRSSNTNNTVIKHVYHTELPLLADYFCHHGSHWHAITP